MDVQRIAAFSDGGFGGNPAGVVICEVLPEPEAMQRVAAEVGYAETAFAAPQGGGWRVRYFAPAMEVPFCGHATIALGAALAARGGDGVHHLQLNDAAITVEGFSRGGTLSAALQSPVTRSDAADPTLVADALALFSYTAADLDSRLPPAVVEAGARHLAIALRDRGRLSRMRYAFEAGRTLMMSAGLVTILLVRCETPRLFHARNAFAVGGLVEDPATGAAAAAWAGYLRDLGWSHGGAIEIVQGEDMGMRSRLHVEIPPERGATIRVSGEARIIA